MIIIKKKKGKFSQPRIRQPELLEEEVLTAEELLEQEAAAAEVQAAEAVQEPVSQAVPEPESVDDEKSAEEVDRERLEEEFRRMTAAQEKAPGKPKGWSGILKVGLISFVSVVLLGIAIFLFLLSRDDGLIFDNVFALGVNLGGMTVEEAEAAIAHQAEEMFAQSLTIQLQDRALTLEAGEVNVEIDAAGIAQAAFDHGRQGNMFERARARSAAALTTWELDAASYLRLDNAYVRDAVAQLAAGIESTLTQPVVTVEGQRPDITKFALPDRYPKMEDEPEEEEEEEEEEENTGITIIPFDEPYYVEGGQSITIRPGIPGRHLDEEDLREQILRAYTTGNLEVLSYTYEEVLPEQVDLGGLYAQYCLDPVNSVLNLETYEASKEVLGYGFVVEDVQKLLDALPEGGSVEVEFQFLLPEFTKASLEKEIFTDVLVAIDTPHTWNNNRTNNLILACEAINGYVVKPGATFSFNEVVGERTAEKGYREATVYSGMQSVPEVGGGVCQVASTLYYGALLADFEIVERAVHTFTVDYVPMGMDATVYWGYLDFKFKNNTGHPLKIYMSVHDGSVYLEILGTETKDYYIEMEWVQESRTDWETKEVVRTDANAAQYQDYDIGDTIVTPYTGYTGNSYKCKYDKQTDELISREWEDYSSYSKRDKEVLVAPHVPEPDPEPVTEPTTEPPTEPTTEPPTEPTTQP